MLYGDEEVYEMVNNDFEDDILKFIDVDFRYFFDFDSWFEGKRVIW